MTILRYLALAWKTATSSLPTPSTSPATRTLGPPQSCFLPTIPCSTQRSIRELLSNAELGAEGREMGHCVYIYAKSCRNGSTSIWSLGVEDGKGHRHRILTIAIDPRSRTITQIRDRFNALPNAKNKKNLERAYQKMLLRSQKVLGQWMSREFISKRC